ncbi:MAG: serine hydrolase domain-containing protein [Gemmatimonadales bacterium]
MTQARRLKSPGAKLVLLALGTLGLPSQVHAQADPFGSVRQYARALVEDGSLPSVAIVASRAGRTVFDEAFGWADRERRVAATTSTMYSLASISKPFTGTGLMMLVQAGRVDLDHPINRYLGDHGVRALEGSADEATVRRVGNHTAGLPLHYQFFYEGDGQPRPPMTESVDRYAILIAPSGSWFNYSNLGFGLLELVIERVSGRSYAEFMRDRVFTPLGLHRTAVFTAPPAGDTVAVRYDTSGRPIPWYDFDHRGASAVYASARDLARYGAYHLGHGIGEAVLTTQSIGTLLEPTARRAANVGYGLGWATYDDEIGHPALGHGGGMPGVATQLRIFPETDAVVVVLANAANNGLVSELSRRATAALLGATPPTPDQPAAEPFEAPGQLVGAWRGTLQTWRGSVPVELDLSRDSVWATLGGARAAVQGPAWDGNRLSGRFVGTIPTPDASRRPTSIVLDLHLANGRLSGAMSAVARDAYAVSSYARLERAAR